MTRSKGEARTTGTIKTLHTAKGFGFIRADDGTEFFFHRSDVDDFDGLQRGDLVRFAAASGAKGPRAEQVERV
jgi:CspA family cold shock protein